MERLTLTLLKHVQMFHTSIFHPTKFEAVGLVCSGDFHIYHAFVNHSGLSLGLILMDSYLLEEMVHFES